MSKEKISKLSVEELVGYLNLSDRVCGQYEKILRGNSTLNTEEGRSFQAEYSKFLGIYSQLMEESRSRLSSL